MELILVINAGSSSIKGCLFKGDDPSPIWQVHTDWKENFEKELEKALKTLPNVTLSCIGHRVVHGGERFIQTTLIDAAVKQDIKEQFFLAPLHNPINLAGIETCEHLFPHIPQFAAFDTAFHATLNAAAYTYPIPEKYRKQCVRRFGFHGLSYAYCSQAAKAFVGENKKMIICHLGAGASLCAIDKGKSVDTTMGMTPLEGLMMATRSGSIDPGAILYLLQENKCTAQTLEKELNEASGLLGVSGLYSQMQKIIDYADHGDANAQLAFKVYIHRLRSCIGSMIGALGGLEALIFTAGIGENAALVREQACANFSFLGIHLDPKKK
ncbi:MAG: Acetate kinase [Chlamydiales bacterium]|nr:Acetate kinase [Chlamydiales bacterium]